MKSNTRIAFVIDALPALGGGEKVLFTALETYPEADIFTLVYNKEAFARSPIAHRDIKTSYLDALPLVHRRHRLFLPLMPAAIERFDLRPYERIVCFSYAVAHGVQNYNGARHVSYTYTPMRYAWTDLNINGQRTRKNPFLDWVMQAFRDWDRNAAARVHQFASISGAVSKRIQGAYGREAPVIYPPVELERFHPCARRGEYYLTVSRLVAHKRIDLLVEAFSRLGLPLLIIGEGPELLKLKKTTASNIQFLGYESDQKVAELLGEARGFVCAAEEDFGIAIVEAQAAGCPVIAYGQGGALETVQDGLTGLLFQEQSVDSLIEAVERFERHASEFHVEDLLHNARRFSKGRFLKEFRAFVGESRG
jgi:glycosyltransferase involved in cell wall biosynthesis